MPRAELEQELERAALPCVLELKPELDQERLVLPSGVEVGFTIDKDATASNSWPSAEPVRCSRSSSCLRSGAAAAARARGHPAKVAMFAGIKPN
jgi:hypothetical protein